MTVEDQEKPNFAWFNEAIAHAMQVPYQVAQQVTTSTAEVGQVVSDSLHHWLSKGTTTVGEIVTPIVDNPLVRFATKVPGVNWLMAALGQVDVAKVQKDVDDLRLKYPNDSPAALAQRVIMGATYKAAGVGLLTNAIPPLALMLFAVDIGAIAALQAEMIYQIATIYGFSPTDPSRRGEVLALWGLSTGSSGALKTGLSIVELLPGIGTVVGVTTDTALLSGIGYLACRFYEDKQRIVANNP